jgi:hypothetical protein
MSGGGKGGSQESKVEIPAYLENASKEALNRARDTGNIGYMPYMGPDVAAFDPMQVAAMQSNADAASAFGLGPSGMNVMDSMPEAQDFGGVQGYSSFPIFDMAVKDLEESRPGQVAAYDKLYTDPVTGQGGFKPDFRHFRHGGDPIMGGGGGGNSSGYDGLGIPAFSDDDRQRMKRNLA